jgi:hypothetical protein
MVIRSLISKIAATVAVFAFLTAAAGPMALNPQPLPPGGDVMLLGF